MTNKNYIKGIKKERKFVNEARAKGWISFRSAGSHSPIDVVSIDTEFKVINLIQSKPDFWNEKQRKNLEEKNKDLNGIYKVTFLVA